MLSQAAQELIEDARACMGGPDETFTLEEACEAFYGNGFADEEAGSITEGAYHVARIGQFLMFTDTQGFVSVEEYSTEGRAESVMDACRDDLYRSDHTHVPNCDYCASRNHAGNERHNT